MALRFTVAHALTRRSWHWVFCRPGAQAPIDFSAVSTEAFPIDAWFQSLVASSASPLQAAHTTNPNPHRSQLATIVRL